MRRRVRTRIPCYSTSSRWACTLFDLLWLCSSGEHLQRQRCTDFPTVAGDFVENDLNKLKNLYLGCEAANLRQEVHSERPYSLENPTHLTLNQ